MAIFRSIHSRLWFLVGLIFVAFIGVLAYTMWYDEQDDVAFAQIAVSKLAEQTASEYEHIFQDIESLSGIISDQPGVFEPDGCDNRVKDFNTFYHAIDRVIITSPSGEVVCFSPVVPGVGLNLSGETWFQSALQNSGFHVSQPFQDPINGDLSLATSYPYLDTHQNLIGFVIFQLNLEHFQYTLTSQLLPENSVVSLVDADGKLVIQSSNNSSGESIIKPEGNFLDMAPVGISGSSQGEGGDPIKRLYGSASVSSLGWRVYTGIPTDFIYAHTRSVLPHSLLAILLVTSSLTLITYFVVRWIEQPIHALSEMVKQAGEGKLVSHAPVQGPDEIVGIGKRFQAMLVSRSLSEAALRSSQLHLTEIISTAMDAIITVDQEQKIFLFNAAAERVFRCKAADVLGKSLDVLVPERYRRQHSKQVKQFGITGQTNRSMGIGNHLSGLRMDGEEFPMEASISQARLGDQHFFTVILRDITERKQAMTALRSSEERFRRLAENAPSIILRFNVFPELACEYISPAVYRITGYAPDEFYANSSLSTEIIFKEDKPIFEHILRGDIQDSQTFELRWVCKDGNVIWTEHHYNPVWGEDDELVSVEGIIIDISMRKRTEQELRKAEAKTRAILDAMPDMMFQITLTGELVDFRTRDESDLIMPPEKFLGVSFRQILPEKVSQQLEEVMRKTWRLGQALSFEYQLVTQDGVLKDFEARVSQTTLGDFLVIVRNITERKQAEFELQETYKALEQAYDATIEGWSKALELRDRETNGHTLRVAETTKRLARTVGIPESDLVNIYRGALLHDIGKMAIPDSILFKPGPLTKEEWQVMRLHPVYAYDMLLPIDYLSRSLNIPLCHHEKWDGSGYPQGLRGEEIPIDARLFSVVDVWDALCSERPYHNAWSIKKTMNYLRSQSGKQFDPSIVAALFRYLRETGQVKPDQLPDQATFEPLFNFDQPEEDDLYSKYNPQGEYDLFSPLGQSGKLDSLARNGSCAGSKQAAEDGPSDQ